MPGLARWSRRQPHALGCCGHFHYALRFAPSSTVQHLRFKAPCLTADALAHPACSTGIGFRRVSSITILTLRKPVAHQRCSATPTVSLALTMTTLTWCLHSIPCAAQCSRFTQGCRCCKPLTHSCRCRHPALPCYRSTAHRHRLSTKSSLEASSRHDFVAHINSGIDEHKRNRYCVSMRSRTSASLPHNEIALHIAL